MPEIHTSLGFFSFPKREVTRTAIFTTHTAACSKRSTGTCKYAPSWPVVCLCLFYESLSRILRASVRSLKLRLCLPLLRMKAALAVLTVSRRRISTLPSPSSTRPSVLFPALPPPSSLCMGRVLSGGTCCNSSLS